MHKKLLTPESVGGGLAASAGGSLFSGLMNHFMNNGSDSSSTSVGPSQAGQLNDQQSQQTTQQLQGQLAQKEQPTQESQNAAMMKAQDPVAAIGGNKNQPYQNPYQSYNPWSA